LIVGAALLLAYWSLSVLQTAIANVDPQQNQVRLDGSVLGVTFGIAVLTGIIFGLIPVFHSLRINLVTELNAGSINLFGSDKRKIVRYGLIVGQIAMSLALLMSAGLLIKSLKHLHEIDIGAATVRVSTMRLLLPAQKYSEPEQELAFYEGLLQEIDKDPRIASATVARELPTEGGNNGYLTLRGSNLEKVLVEWNDVTPNYFTVMNVPFLKGRNFLEQDSQQALAVLHASVTSLSKGNTYEGPPTLVAIVNETMSKKLWPDGTSVGQIFHLGGDVPVTVIGVVGDVKESGIIGPVIPQAYFPLVWAFYRPGRP
jgi:putative ABC transport system permease protein